ncbi:MAG: endonuclease/exonuclease/phosphatase family protein [Nanoarchaeota archaeon]|nr:endonuclease/exonuclease/phosphatase family protein [Nanoarchaeota archaeon]MBU1269598.1 endonuclease/exonuclease/phosphatase family protein [Nanoarchaeota archaeon]MBU1605056.1 endonuclease/exonuclease/phosphatase family protein [Nanoarchaeota archaeon]MBU2442610.1 endonuclease/exonuclease/phosphatase family protein [Nanoarchaeota archaeon]
MRLITYNVEYCDGINRGWKYLDVFKYFKLVKKTLMQITEELSKVNPDILGLIEIDSGSVRFGRKSGSEMFAQKLGMNYWAEKVKYSRRSVYRVLNFFPIVRKQSNAILSKYKIYSTKYYFFSKGMKRLVIQSAIMVPLGEESVELNLFAVHLSLRRKTREKQLQELGDIVSVCNGPKIVFGDFNNFKGFEELQELIQKTGLRDASDNDPFIRTYPSWKPKKHIDHILVSPEIKIKNYEVLDIRLSDHLPVMIDFEIS